MRSTQAEPTKRPTTKKGHWHNIANRRKYLLEFAEKMGFDPMQSDNWNPITATQVKSTMVHLLICPLQLACK